MKRSEMVSKLTVVLGLTHDEHRTYEDMAKLMLKTVEQAGMLPPKQPDCFFVPEVKLPGKNNKWDEE